MNYRKFIVGLDLKYNIDILICRLFGHRINEYEGNLSCKRCYLTYKECYHLKNDLEGVSLKTINQLIENNIEVEDMDDVLNILNNNPDLLFVILESKKEAAKIFENFRLKLSVFTDSCGNETLNILILNNLSAKIALDKELELFKSWFQLYYHKFNGKINLREEFCENL